MNEEIKNNIPEENENDMPRKKNLYVPDKELLAYSKAKKRKNKKKNKENTDKPIEIQTNNKKVNLKDKLFNFIKFSIPKKSDGTKKIIIKSVAIVAAVTLVCSIVYLSFYFVDLSQQNAEIDNIRATYELNREDYSYNNDGQFSKFDALKKQNNDICGWLEIPGTEVNNPVYQTVDNEYYITHDMNKDVNSYGALFLDYRCDINPIALSQNQIIYGHNMRFGAMFGTLDEYRKLEYYKANPIIRFDSLYENRTYKIVAIMITNSSVDSTFGYDFTAYRAKFANQDEFMKWISQCRDRSIIDTNVDVIAQDEVITLSTCCYDFDDARFVIVARLVRENEPATVDTSTAVYNSDELYSAEYYAKKGISIPKNYNTYD